MSPFSGSHTLQRVMSSECAIMISRDPRADARLGHARPDERLNRPTRATTGGSSRHAHEPNRPSDVDLAHRRVTTGHNGDDGRGAFFRFLPATSTHRYALTTNLFLVCVRRAPSIQPGLFFLALTSLLHRHRHISVSSPPHLRLRSWIFDPNMLRIKLQIETRIRDRSLFNLAMA